LGVLLSRVGSGSQPLLTGAAFGVKPIAEMSSNTSAGRKSRPSPAGRRRPRSRSSLQEQPPIPLRTCDVNVKVRTQDCVVPSPRSRGRLRRILSTGRDQEHPSHSPLAEGRGWHSINNGDLHSTHERERPVSPFARACHCSSQSNGHPRPCHRQSDIQLLTYTGLRGC
jgi:hypothetical protein